eukprot:scaffold1782_cov123-Isochrysis_galbana.AAC.12
MLISSGSSINKDYKSRHSLSLPLHPAHAHRMPSVVEVEVERKGVFTLKKKYADRVAACGPGNPLLIPLPPRRRPLAGGAAGQQPHPRAAEPPAPLGRYPLPLGRRRCPPPCLYRRPLSRRPFASRRQAPSPAPRCAWPERARPPPPLQHSPARSPAP